MYDGGMTASQLVLVSLGLGLVAGALTVLLIFVARSASKRRSEQINPTLSPAAIELLDDSAMFAVVLNSALSPIYANAAARDNEKITGVQLREPEFLRRAKQVLTTGVTDVCDPDTINIEGAIRLRIVRLQHHFVVVFAEDLGEEQRLNTMRRDFIANMSHELKTPIAALSLLAEAVGEAAEEPEVVRKFAESMRKESKRLTDLSRDIIQLSEAQAMLRAEDRELVDLVTILQAEVDNHKEYAQQRGVKIVLNTKFPGSQRPQTYGRASSIGTALANLLSNAVRHSPEGSSVGVGLEASNGKCRITVTDHGEGIAQEHLPRLFERFYRVDNARSRQEGGTGLGLSIVKHTIQSHGGDIEVWSKLGEGSSFTITLPIIETDPQEKSRGRSHRADRKKESGPAS